MSRKITRRALLALLLAGPASGLAACGKKGSLRPPKGRPSDFPRKFPTR